MPFQRSPLFGDAPLCGVLSCLVAPCLAWTGLALPFAFCLVVHVMSGRVLSGLVLSCPVLSCHVPSGPVRSGLDWPPILC
eukprot:6235438-Heterocapsa_arctica.AAC.1